MNSLHNSCPFDDVEFVLLIDASSQKRSCALSLAAVAIAYREFALPELSDAGIGVSWLGGSSAARHPGQQVSILHFKNIDMLDNFQLIFSARINDAPVQTRLIDALKFPNDRPGGCLYRAKEPRLVALDSPALEVKEIDDIGLGMGCKR